LLSHLPSRQLLCCMAAASRFRCSSVEISGSWASFGSGRRSCFLPVVFWVEIKKTFRFSILPRSHHPLLPSVRRGDSPSIHFFVFSLLKTQGCRLSAAGFQRRLFFVRESCSLKGALLLFHEQIAHKGFLATSASSCPAPGTCRTYKEFFFILDPASLLLQVAPCWVGAFYGVLCCGVTVLLQLVPLLAGSFSQAAARSRGSSEHTLF